MAIFNSIINNIKLISFHIYTWFIRFLVIYIAMIPLKNQMSAFFNERTINEQMLNGLDVNAIFEFVMRGFYSTPAASFGVLLSLLFMISFLLLIIDPLVEAGFIGALNKNEKSAFWPSLKENGMKIILVKFILLIPNLIIIGVALFAANIFAAPNYGLMSMGIAFLVVGTFFLFLYKLNDLVKYHLIIKKTGIGNALSYGFNKVFSKFSETLILNIIVAVLFFLGFAINQTIDASWALTTTGAIFLLACVQQLFIMLKQILRYSYLDAVIKQQSMVDQTSTIEVLEDSDSNIEFDDFIKE